MYSKKPVKLMPVERFLAYHTIYSYTPHPLGKTIALGTDVSGQINVWLCNRMGYMRRITPFTERRCLPVSWSPDGSKLLFISDFQGNEVWQIHVYDDWEGWFYNIVFEEPITHIVSESSWSPDSLEVAFLANRGEKSRFDLYIKNVEDNKETFILKGLGGLQDVYWLRNGYLLLVDIRNISDQTIYLVNVESKSLKELTPHRGEVVFKPIESWANGFFMLTDYDKEFVGIAYYSFMKKSFKIIYTANWDVETAALGKTYLLFSVNKEGYSKLHMIDIERNKLYSINTPPMVIKSIKAARKKDLFFIAASTPTTPINLYVLNLDEGRVLKRVTDMFYGVIIEERLSKPESIWYKSFDGRKVHAFLYKPKIIEEEIPVALVLHGGPWAQARPKYDPLIQYLVHKRIAIATPNFRGSSGYGRQFMSLINRDWGGGELRDVEYLVRYLLEQDWVDSKRLAVFGASFGGYLTLMCIGKLPQYWKVAAEWFGPSNLITFTKAIPPYWRRYVKKWIGDPEDPEDVELLRERSPITYVDNIKCPLLVIQGAQDIRVVKRESDQIVEKLKQKGIEVKYIVFPDEGHGFTKEKNKHKAIIETASFLEKHLLFK